MLITKNVKTYLNALDEVHSLKWQMLKCSVTRHYEYVGVISITLINLN